MGRPKTKLAKKPKRTMDFDIVQPKDRKVFAQRHTAAWVRTLVAQMYLTGGHTSETIAEYLDERFGIKIKSVTVRAHLSVLKKDWQEQAAQDTATMITQELGKLAQLEKYAIETLRDGSMRVADNGAFVQLGYAKDFCDIMLKIAKRRSNLLGLDKTPALILKDARTSELSDEELEAIIKGKRDIE